MSAEETDFVEYLKNQCEVLESVIYELEYRGEAEPPSKRYLDINRLQAWLDGGNESITRAMAR